MVDHSQHGGIEPLLSKSETARILGASVRSVEGWISRGLLKVTRPGNSSLVRLDPSDVRDFIERAKSAPAAQSTEGANQ